MVSVLAPRAGAPGLVASLLRWGLQIIDVVSGEGAITAYTVGPAFSGARFRTIQEAFTQADNDGFGVTARVEVYPGTYPDAVNVPATLPRWNLVGSGTEAGVEIVGAFSVAVPESASEFAIQNVQFLGGASFTQAAATGLCTAIFTNCRFTTNGITITAPTLSPQFWDCTFSGPMVWVLRALWCFGGRFFNGLDTTCDPTGVGSNSFQKCYFQGVTAAVPITGAGRAISLTHCIVYHGGSPAVVDNCDLFSEYSQNTFSRNAGPAGVVIDKTGGASSLTDGGNVYVDGSTYPFIAVAAPADRPNRGQTDDEIRNVLHVSGSPVLAPAQVGGQRKTTVVKDDNGGAVGLPALATVEPGCTVLFKDGSFNSSASPWFVVPDGAETIDGAVNYQISLDGQAVELQADQAAGMWIVVGAYL